jgi:HPt (histidine-containing phosphotransfer) domain-containing protein
MHPSQTNNTLSTEHKAVFSIQENSILIGINIQVGLDLTEYNTSLYSKLLLLFLQSQGDFSMQFDNAKKEGDFSQLHHISHSLKSSSGAIGALNLRKFSQDLEDLCLKEIMDDDLIFTVNNELRRVLEGIRKYQSMIER